MLPRAYASMKGTGAEELGFSDTAQYLRLQMFLQKNGGFDVGPSRPDGACMFSSVLVLLGSCQGIHPSALQKGPSPSGC